MGSLWLFGIAQVWLLIRVGVYLCLPEVLPLPMTKDSIKGSAVRLMKPWVTSSGWER